MATNPRIPSALAGEPEHFGSVTAHAGELFPRFFALYAELWQRGIVAAEIKEVTRIRNARVTDCGY